MKQRPSDNGMLLRHFKKAAPTVLTVISAVGMAATVVTAVRATPKAVKLIENKKSEENADKLTPSETVKTVWRCYIPTFLIGATTIACMFSVCVLSRKQQTAYITAYTFLDNTFRNYKEKTKSLYGSEADKNIRAAIVEERHENIVIRDNTQKIYPAFSDDDECPTEGSLVFYEEHRDEFFEMSMSEILLAEYHLNRNFILRGYVTLNEFYEFLGLPKTDMGDILGWSQYKGEAEYGYTWIDFEHDKRRLDDGMEYYIISTPFPPTADFEDW